jgi:sulfonate transport system substrate-binding protein
MMRKKVRVFLLLLLMVVVSLWIGYGKEKAAKVTSGIKAKEIRIATQPIPHYAPVFIAKKKGWLEAELKKAGVTVKWTSFAAGPPMNEAFAAGEEDVGLLGDTPAIIARAAGQDIRIIGLASGGPKALAVVVRKNSNITAPKELKGKKVAAVKGSYGHHLLSLVLKNAGLTTDDIQFINLPLTDIGTALTTGDIDAGAVWEPLITQLEENDLIRVIADGTNIKKGIVVIIATHKFAAQNPQLVKTFLTVYKRGYDFIKANPTEAADLIAAEVKLTSKQLRKVLAKFNYDPAIGPDDIEELKKTEAFMRSAELIKTPVNIDTFVDTNYAKVAGIQ